MISEKEQKTLFIWLKVSIGVFIVFWLLSGYFFFFDNFTEVIYPILKQNDLLNRYQTEINLFFIGGLSCGSMFAFGISYVFVSKKEEKKTMISDDK